MTTITAKYVNHAKEGKKFGSVVDPSGAKFMLPVGMQDAFQPGQTYEVPTEQARWGENVVTVIKGRPGSAGSGAIAQPAPPAPQPQAPRPAPTGTCNKDVLITATALMKSFIESGNYGLTDLPALESACIPAAKRIVGASQ